MTDIVARLKAAAYAAEGDAKRHDEALATAPGSYASDFRQWRDEELASAAMAREAAAEIERMMARFTDLAADFERRADACHDLNTPGWEQRDRMRLHGKEAAYRHAMMLARAAQMDGATNG